MRIGQRQAGGRRDGVFLDEELLAIVQRGYGNRTERSVWHKHQGVEGGRRQGGFERAAEPVVELLRVLCMGRICASEVFMRGK
jgi:hypothetical protein